MREVDDHRVIQVQHRKSVEGFVTRWTQSPETLHKSLRRSSYTLQHGIDEASACD